MRKFRVVLLALAGLMCVSAHAEIAGMANGRSANTDQQAGLSVEGGAAFGDISFLGVRVNYKVTDDIVVFGDLGQTDINGADGFTFGGGAYYFFRDIALLENTDFAVKASLHTGSLDRGTYTVGGLVFDYGDSTLSAVSIEAIISGDQIGSTSFGWYANAGIHRIDLDYRVNTEPGIGAGIFGDLAFGQFYAGFDFIDEISLNAGVRYFVN